MKKLLFMAAMVAVSVFTAKAQNNDVPTATLKHGDQTLVFTGQDALQNAYVAAADSGDVITLSSGYFTFLTCSKSLSIYGAGFEYDATTGVAPTEIDYIFLGSEDFTNIDDNGNSVTTTRELNGLHCEGLKFKNSINFNGNAKNISFVKCYSDRVQFGDVVVENISIRQCNLPEGIWGVAGAQATFKNLYISNSYMGGTHPNFSLSCTGKINHCIVTEEFEDSNISWVAANSIFYNNLPLNSTITNNIFVSTSSTDIEAQDEYDNWRNVTNANIWADEGEDGSYASNKTFELKTPEKYVGSDGTQIGLHGGDYPWNKIPSTPRIVESNIDTKTSADGKLKVSIKVEAQTKE